MIPVLALFAAVLPFGELHSGARWIDAPHSAARTPSAARRWEETVYHSALNAGIWNSGNAAIEFTAKGENLIELFLAAPDAFKYSFVLTAAGAVVDDRYRSRGEPERLREKSDTRQLSLIGWVNGPTRLLLQTNAPRYQLLALRWTPRAEYDAQAAPLWLARARYLHAHPIFEEQGNPKQRAEFLEQLYERLVLSHDGAVRAEAALGLARAIYWQAAENHEPRDYRRLEAALRACLKQPPQPLVQQMIATACSGSTSGGRIMLKGELCADARPAPWNIAAPAPPHGAPAWAVEQRRVRLRMDAITRWWVDVRQQQNGELGGAWDDDVEILRHWGPLAFGLGSSIAARGLERLANGVWNSGRVVHGYNATIRDVEHSSEPTTDTQPLLAVLRPADGELLARLKATAACAENWIQRQPDGFFRFRGAWFNCREVDATPSRAIDVHMNTRAMGPALWYAYLSKDPATIQLLARWAQSWVRAMQSTAGGKPAGRFPPAMWSRDGSYLVNSRQWDLPDAEWDYFQWSGRSQEALASLMLAVYELTGERKWLDAATQSFQQPDPRFRDAPEAFIHWRQLTGEDRYDTFFDWRPATSAETVLKQMESAARTVEQQLSGNFEMFTSEPLYTDRIYYRLPPEYRHRLFGGEAPRGDRFPTFAVTWIPDDVDYARAVLAATSRSLQIRLYNFHSESSVARFRVWRLETGRYQWRAGDRQGVFHVAARPALVEIPMPPAAALSVTIEKTNQ